MDVEGYLSACAVRVDKFLDGALPPSEEPPVRLHAAMRHLLFPGGKRLRPALVFAGAEAVAASPEQALPAAAAVELIHTYSLVHDDLPCMDDDAERRGLPTVHVAFDEATAVLAGDALQAAAFEVLAQAAPEHVPGALRDLASVAGSRELVGGQHDDLFFDTAAATLEAVESVHARKSAALIAVSVVSGARLGGADADQLARLSRFSRKIGVAFQIADDVLDADEGDQCSVVGHLGIDGARERAESLLSDALVDLESFGASAESLRGLSLFAVRRDR